MSMGTASQTKIWLLGHLIVDELHDQFLDDR